MNNKVTELVFVIDRSGSMSGLESDTIGVLIPQSASSVKKLQTPTLQLFS